MARQIYFDNAASTPVDPRVIEAMQLYWRECFANASSLHTPGRQVKEALDRARATLAAMIQAEPDEIIFTGSGTESNNLALKGIAFAHRDRGNHLVVSAIEHDCVLNSARWLAAQGFDVTVLPVDADGLVDPDEVKRAIGSQTILVSIMHANNEIGTVQPLADIGAICRECGVLFHTDACQSFGKLPIDVRKQNIDLMTVNAHKIYGPKGAAALFVRRGVTLDPWQHGGGHERGLRSATENLPGIVGLVRAAELCHQEMPVEIPRLIQLRNRIIDTVMERLPNAYLNGHRYRRLPNHVSLSFEGCEGEGMRLLLELDKCGVAVSAGSACSSNDAENKPSHVLAAIGRNPIQARGALRVTLGRFNTDEEVGLFLHILPEVVRNLRSISSVSIGV